MSHTPDQLTMTPFYGFFHHVARSLHEAFFRGEVVGTENIPQRGPYLIAANHASNLDPLLAGCHAARQMRFFARRTLWNHRLLGWWLSRIESIPVDRDTGDVGAIKRVLQALHEDRAVVLFPEGTRTLTGHFGKPKAGVGLLACKTGAPVVPCRIYGSFEAFGKGKSLPNLGVPVTVVFGRPLTPADYDAPDSGKERYQIASQRIFDRITHLPMPRYPVL